LIGSSWNTSRPAPAIWPFRSASTSASRSTSAPRAVLMRMAVRFVSENSFRPRKARV